jgi:3-phenylpropionate/trans-cinnamate dioxygenase ferredoxin reductase subunit
VKNGLMDQLQPDSMHSMAPHGMTDKSASGRVVIIGAGQAGCTIAIELRKLGYPGSITMLGAEPHPPYQRPPLSKAYLAGKVASEKLMLMPEQRRQDADIEFLGGVEVLEIDRQRKTVLLAKGRSISYDQLALTTGGRNRCLPLPGADRCNVMSLRSIEDAERIREYWRPGTRLVIVGGGFIGLEAAAVAVTAGLRVTVLETLPHVLSRVTVPKVSSFYEQAHRAAGVTIQTNVQIDRFEGSPAVTHVVLTNGSCIEADLVLVGIGLIPNTDLAETAGLDCKNGILVNEFARTSDPLIVAAGDCANHPSAYAQSRLRLESVQNAVDQARTAAATLCGQSKPYNAVPWFWSDQYDLKLQVVGLSSGHDQWVIRGDTCSRSFSVFYFLSGRLIAADSVNRTQDHMLARRLIARGARPDPLKLADGSICLSDAATSA